MRKFAYALLSSVAVMVAVSFAEGAEEKFESSSAVERTAEFFKLLAKGDKANAKKMLGGKVYWPGYGICETDARRDELIDDLIEQSEGKEVWKIEEKVQRVKDINGKSKVAREISRQKGKSILLDQDEMVILKNDNLNLTSAIVLRKAEGKYQIVSSIHAEKFTDSKE